MKKSFSGFTIFELIIVVTIIGILGAIAALSLSKIQMEARNKQRASSIALIAESLEEYYDKNGEYPDCTLMTQDINVVATNTLEGIDPNVLTTPKATKGTNSIICSDISGTGSDVYAYVISGFKWTLKYREEDTDIIKIINSRRSPTGPKYIAVSGFDEYYGHDKYVAIREDNKVFTNRSGTLLKFGPDLPAGSYTSITVLRQGSNDRVLALTSNGRVRASEGGSWWTESLLPTKATPWVSIASVSEGGNYIALNQDGTVSPTPNGLPNLPAGTYTSITYLSGYALGTDMYGLPAILRNDGMVYFEKWSYSGSLPNGTYNYSWGNLGTTLSNGTAKGLTACGKGCNISNEGITWWTIYDTDGNLWRSSSWHFDSGTAWTLNRTLNDSPYSAFGSHYGSSGYDSFGIDKNGQIQQF